LESIIGSRGVPLAKASPEMKSNEIYHTIKNIAIAGGLLILVAAYRP
jgi:hypothetical protein